MIKIFEVWGTFEDYLKANEAPSDEITFNKDFEIIGLPTGQVIYMNVKQLTYFKGREYVRFIKLWKKPMAGGFLPIKLNNYCFEDTDYKTIMELMNSISW